MPKHEREHRDLTTRTCTKEYGLGSGPTALPLFLRKQHWAKDKSQQRQNCATLDLELPGFLQVLWGPNDVPVDESDTPERPKGMEKRCGGL